MPSPFPGMDPFLENPSGWKNLHSRLIVAISDVLVPPISPGYVVVVQEDVYVLAPEPTGGNGIRRARAPDLHLVETGQPAVSSGGVGTVARPVEVTLPVPEIVRLPYLEIRDAKTGGAVVTVIELLSPTNKRRGRGRDEYLLKRDELLASGTHLVEIDLLRAWEPMPISGAPKSYDYSIMVSRQQARPAAQLYPFTVREPFPEFTVPLLRNDEEPVLDLGAALAAVYDRGRLDLSIDYSQSAEPPLSEDDARWAREIVRLKNADG
ncbi:MAG TPA: DUF4058 family protein [Armatimonadota bacterium]|nr:DUF4058 family protein [Armatimonadota bacterium]